MVPLFFWCCVCLLHVLIAEEAERRVLVVCQADCAPAAPRLEGICGRRHVVLSNRGRRPADKDALVRHEGDATLVYHHAVVHTVAAVLNVARLLGCQEAAPHEVNDVLHMAAAGMGAMVVTRLRVVGVLLLRHRGGGRRETLGRGRHVGGEEGGAGGGAHHADHHAGRGGEGGVEGGRHGDFGRDFGRRRTAGFNFM